MPNKAIQNPCWYCPEIDTALPMELSPDSDGYLYDEALQTSGCNSLHGIQWCYEGRTIRIHRHKQRLCGYPSPAFDKVVVVYPLDKIFTEPNNLVIYNPDGSLHMRPEIPLSCAPKDTWPYTSPIKPLSYLDVHWTKYEGKITMAIDLELGLQDALETRIFNPYTGECEDFLYTWKL